MRELNSICYAHPLLRAELLGEDAVEEVQEGRLATGGFGEDGVKALGDMPEPEALRVDDDAGAHEFITELDGAFPTRTADAPTFAGSFASLSLGLGALDRTAARL